MRPGPHPVPAGAVLATCPTPSVRLLVQTPTAATTGHCGPAQFRARGVSVLPETITQIDGGRHDMTTHSLEDRTVLITGANRGIGQALVDESLRRGARRVYAGTRQPLQHRDARVTPLALDVTDSAQIS